MEAPEIRYARSGDVSIAYQVVGEGPLDVVLAPGFPSHLEHGWEQPRLAHFYRRLAAFSRLILFDKRGLGLSDRVADADLPGVQQRMDDIRAVLDEVGSAHAAVIGISDGGPIAAVFAATYPERTSHLVLVNSYARRVRADNYPWAPSADDWRAFEELTRQRWGEPLFLDLLFPTCAGDEGFADWWATYLRRSASPGAAGAYLRMNAQIDVRSVLPAIHVPTLILHSSGDQICPVDGARYMAKAIPGARFVELPGADHHIWVTDAEGALGEIEQFLMGERQAPATTSVLATLLFTDIVGSTETAAELGDRRWASLLASHNAVIRSQLERYQGRELDTSGDGFLAMFDGPARAVRCALGIRSALDDLGLRIRAGVHTAEVELSEGSVRGVGVHLAARILALAGPGEVLVSRVVHDLALGSGLTFAEHGRHTLKGVPGEWDVLRVVDERP
jgi:pimeloyl-ACP methyl ester carboxylesterase/plasmid stabilization system protein ParE